MPSTKSVVQIRSLSNENTCQFRPTLCRSKLHIVGDFAFYRQNRIRSPIRPGGWQLHASLPARFSPGAFDKEVFQDEWAVATEQWSAATAAGYLANYRLWSTLSLNNLINRAAIWAIEAR